MTPLPVIREPPDANGNWLWKSTRTTRMPGTVWRRSAIFWAPWTRRWRPCGKPSAWSLFPLPSPAISGSSSTGRGGTWKQLTRAGERWTCILPLPARTFRLHGRMPPKGITTRRPGGLRCLHLLVHAVPATRGYWHTCFDSPHHRRCDQWMWGGAFPIPSRFDPWHAAHSRGPSPAYRAATVRERSRIST